jgi:hypothetical protein
MNRGAFAHVLKLGLLVAFVVLAMSACGVALEHLGAANPPR